MKEEQERRRRESEQRHREEMQNLAKKEEAKDKPEDQEAETQPPGEGPHVTKDIKETNNKVQETGKKVVSKQDEERGDNESASQTKSKDPRVKVKETKKLTIAEEKKAIEMVKKSFKIPKMKKTESVADVVTSKDDKAKLKVINMFEPTEKKIKPKNAEKSATDKDKEKKEAKMTPDTLINSEPEPLEEDRTKTPDGPRAGRTSARFMSDSDSDTGLTIAEYNEDKMEVDSSPAKLEEPTEPRPGPSSRTAGIIDKEELTKELLKNIVATLDPKEAAKLLLKAQQLDKIEKLTLEELKEFLFSKEEEKPKPAPKSKKKIKNKIKSIPAPAPGTRRSGRLRRDSFEEPVEHPEQDNDSETETFVIEPKEVKQKKRKSQKESWTAARERQLEEEELQDDMVSSSNIDEVSNKTAEKKEPEPSSQLKIEIPEEEKTELSVKVSPTVALSKPGKSRMAPKSKTWFPRDDRGAAKRDVLSLASPPNFMSEQELKKASQEADPIVFFGKEEGIEELLKSDFGINPGHINAELAEKFRKGHKAVSELSQKLTDKSKAVIREQDEPPPEASEQTTPTKLCSKIKLFRPSLPVTVKPALVKSLELKPRESVKVNQENLIEKLKRQLKASVQKKAEV